MYFLLSNGLLHPNMHPNRPLPLIELLLTGLLPNKLILKGLLLSNELLLDSYCDGLFFRRHLFRQRPFCPLALIAFVFFPSFRSRILASGHGDKNNIS